MNPFTNLVLPQNDTPENRAARQQELVNQQKSYRYDYPEIVAGLPMAAAPIPVEVSLLWVTGVVELVLTLGENLLNIVAPNLVSLDPHFSITLGGSSDSPPALPRQPQPNETTPKEAVDLHDFLLGTKAELARRRSVAQAAPAPKQASSGEVQAFAGGSSTLATVAFADIESWLKGLLEKLGELIGKLLGIYGRAGDVQAYVDQFRTLPLPWPSGVYQSDEVFAQMRIAGPNPVMLRRVTREEISQTGVQLHELNGALYVADYKDLLSLVPGTNPQQKYVFAPKAFFYVPASGNRRLRPLAIQIGQEKDSPIYGPGDGTAWEIAKIIVNMADGNYHELISHLGLTHLLTEPFVLATLRQLDPQHPLNALLMPHFAGTLLINYAAQTTLITDGGAVDKLLTGTIESSRALSASAVKAVRYNQSFFPDTLAQRGVADREALPDYPYRDDGLLLWHAIHAWVVEYVGIYYPNHDDIAGDYELQAWVQELVSAGHLQDIGEGKPGETPRIATAGYLAGLLTQVIFTASVQHAAVNFPQRTIMAFTPAMPLAAYGDFPAASGQPPTQVLDVLPPLQMSLLQQLVGTALGGVEYTTLGGYQGELSVVQVGEALRRFQGRLQKIEEAINGANHLGTRTNYSTLLPSLIPQSINI